MDAQATTLSSHGGDRFQPTDAGACAAMTDARDNAKGDAVRNGRVVIGIATSGRRGVLSATLAHLAHQTRLPDLVLVSVADPQDIDLARAAALPFPLRHIVAPKGLCCQRNAILDALASQDILLFLDDDFLIAPDYLARLDRLMAETPQVVLVTGEVLADGVTGPGLSHAAGAEILAAAPSEAQTDRTAPIHSGYGCNFAVRMAPIRAAHLRFDERLPYYGWLEDLDFSRQLAPHGEVVKAEGLRGVHLGTKAARSPGLRLGYSQVANAIYLVRKGTMHRRHARNLVSRNIAANLVFSVRPRPWADHRGRLRGNALALVDWARGRLDPDRIRTL